MNVDLGLGSMVESILDLQSEEDSAVQEKFYTSIARCSYGYAGMLVGYENVPIQTTVLCGYFTG